MSSEAHRAPASTASGIEAVPAEHVVVIAAAVAAVLGESARVQSICLADAVPRVRRVPIVSLQRGARASAARNRGRDHNGPAR